MTGKRAKPRAEAAQPALGRGRLFDRLWRGLLRLPARLGRGLLRSPGRLWRCLRRLPPGLLLFAMVACLNFASMSRELSWGDARPIYEVADSLVTGHGVSVATRWPVDADPGRGGRFYAAQPLLPSLLHVPGAGLSKLLLRLKVGAEVADLINAAACHVQGGLVGALVVWLFFRLCLRYGASERTALFASLLLGTGSLIWVYARYPFSEIAQAACFTGFFLALARLLKGLQPRAAIWAGLWAGMLVNTKYVYALSLPGALAVLLVVHRRDLRRLGLAVLLAGVGLVPGLVMALVYNFLRFGSVTKTGYVGVGEVMVENVLLGLWGLLFSPGKSVFLYTPPLVLALLGLPRFWRSQRATVWAMLATIMPVVLFYCRFPSWPGDWAWGPRYLVFAIPVLLLPAISLLASMRWPRRFLALALLALGIFVQVLGNAFYWDHYLRIALDVRSHWLGQPNRSASLTADKGGYCEGCFEDVYPTVWLAPLQPILGHLWLLRHVPFHHDWDRASKDAPWRRHTRLVMDSQASYDRVRVDHWLYDMPSHRRSGWLILFGLVGTGAAAGVLLVIRPRQGPGGRVAISTSSCSGEMS